MATVVTAISPDLVAFVVAAGVSLSIKAAAIVVASFGPRYGGNNVKGQATMAGEELEESLLATLMMTRAQLDAGEEIPKQINIQGRKGAAGEEPPTQIHWLMLLLLPLLQLQQLLWMLLPLSVQIRRVHNSAPLGQLQWQWQWHQHWQLQLHSAVWQQQQQQLTGD